MTLSDFSRFSPKQLEYLTTSHNKINLAYGAMRSGKNMVIGWRLMFYAKFQPLGYEKTDLIFSGTSVKNVYRIVLRDLFEMVGKGNWEYNRTDGSGRLYNRQFFSFGFCNENSDEAIQGLTAGGAVGTEWTLAHQKFREALPFRCSIKKAQQFYDCNPSGPYHPVKTDLIDSPALQKDLNVYHFLMSDNPSLDDDPGYYDMICRLYPKGSLPHRRNVLGEWAQAEGLIYDCFTERNKCHRWELPLCFNKICVGIDYGTKNHCVFLLIGTVQQVSGPDHYYIIKAYYYSGRETGITKSSGQYKDDLVAFIGHYQVDAAFCDPEAAHFVAELEQAGFNMGKVDNSVIPGINTCINLFYADLLTICEEDCVPLISELGLYPWENKHIKDTPKKIHDHGPDAMRYVVHSLENLPNAWDVWKQMSESEDDYYQ